MKIPTPVKITVRLLVASLALAAASTTLRAADPSPATAPSAPAAAAPGGEITDDQDQKFKAAFQQAMQDPQVLAAQEAAVKAFEDYRTLVKNKIIAKQPKLQPLLDKADKIAQARSTGEIAPPMTPDEETTLKNAFQTVMSDPDLMALQAKVVAARKAKIDALRAAILKADPSASAILAQIDKINAQRAAGGGPPVQ